MRYINAEDAKKAALQLNGKTDLLGTQKLRVVLDMSYKVYISKADYNILKPQINEAKDRIATAAPGCNIREKVGENYKNVEILCTGRNLKDLQYGRSILEQIFSVEALPNQFVLHFNVLFHKFGQETIKRYNVSLRKDKNTGNMTIMGPEQSRKQAIDYLNSCIQEYLNEQKEHTFVLPKGSLKLLMGKDGKQLFKWTKEYNVWHLRINRKDFTLQFHGMSENAKNFIKRIEEELKNFQKSSTTNIECGICFDDVENPYTLLCGHQYCSICLNSQLESAIANNDIPVKCVTCQTEISIGDCQGILTDSDAQKKMWKAAWRTFLLVNPDLYKPCLTPGCDQIYQFSVSKF